MLSKWFRFGMKHTFFVELSVVTVLVILCSIRAFLSRKEMGRPVGRMLIAAIVPLVGNMVIASSEDPVICNAGYILYLLGTDLVIYTLLDYTLLYCSMPPLKKISRGIIVTVLVLDAASIFLNSFFMHVYVLEEKILQSGEIYYVLQSGWGHYFHLGLSAVMLIMIAGYYIWKIFTSAALYLEKYLVILLSIVIVGLWEYRNVLMDGEIDRAMIGMAVCAILLYFFAVEYRPIFLKMALHELLVSNMSDAVLFFDKDGKAIYANKRASILFGIDSRSLSRSAQLLGEEITGREFLENHMRVESDFRRQVEIGKEEEQKQYYDVICQRMEDRRGHYLGAFFGIGDNTQVERSRRKSLYRRTHDELTGMPNREMFIDQVNQRLAEDADEEYVMILSDIADFKIINDIYGRDIADRILLGIADCIRSCIHENSLYCRWGADQFAAFAKKSDISPELLEEEIRENVRNENSNSGIKYPVVVHAGYYELKEKSILVSTMIDRCIMAISEVHDDYQKLVNVYDEELRMKRLWEQHINSELPRALQERQIFPYLQPQYDNNGVLTGAEVLVRWQHPKEGFLAPYRFVPIFEKNGMIVKVDTYIWEEACRILNSWKGTEKERLHLSVNISPKDFYFIDIYEVFTSLVERYSLDPSKLHLEVTETVVMNDPTQNFRTINRLREYGFVVEMDDFGSGYSSLNLLRDLPVDVLKIDMAFLGKTKHPQKAEMILSSIISLARQLNMITIAEGVELEEQLNMLRQMGCSIFQGYYFAKPIPLEDFEKLAA